MKALITGAGGFIGSHLAEFLLDKNLEIYGTIHENRTNVEHLKNKINLIEIDITNKKIESDNHVGVERIAPIRCNFAFSYLSVESGTSNPI